MDDRYRKKILKIDQVGVLFENKHDDFWADVSVIENGQEIGVGNIVLLKSEFFIRESPEDAALYTYESGKTIFNEEIVLAEMLKKEVLCAAHSDRIDTLCLLVVLNDTFAWGVAELTELPESEVYELYRHWIKDPDRGPDVWAMRRRNQMAQKPLEEQLRKKGIWDLDALNLRPNDYWKVDDS